MTEIKRIGIWMDHANAHIIEFSEQPKKTTTVTSAFAKQDKDETLQRSESELHNKQQHSQLAYRKSLAAVIRNCGEVLLFGPTDAKIELFNFLRKDPLFNNIKIEVRNADKMSDKQQHAVVRDYFKKLVFKSL